MKHSASLEFGSAIRITDNRKAIRIIAGLAGFFFIMLLPFASLAAEAVEKKVTLKVSAGRIREKPSLKANVEFGLKQGDTVRLLRIRGNWYFVQMEDGRNGWGHKSLFSEPFTATEKKPAVRDTKDAEDDQTVSGKELEEIRVESMPGGKERAIFLLNGPYLPETFALEEEGLRLVCDFSGVHPGASVKKNYPKEINGSFIRKIRIGFHENAEPQKLRVVLDLAEGQDYVVEQKFFTEENLYILIFRKAK